MAYPFNKESVFYRRDDSQFRADAIREAFQHAWNGYTKYAFPHDELHPVSNGHGDSRYERFFRLLLPCRMGLGLTELIQYV